MKSPIADYYNKLGERYYTDWKHINSGMVQIRKFEENFIGNALKNYANSNTPVKVLEVGCGPGRIAEILLKNKKVDYYALDISEKMIDSLKRRFARKANFKEGKVSDISKGIRYSPKTFDVVIAVRVLKYNQNWRQVIKFIHQVVKEKGIFVFTMPNKHSLNVFSKTVLPTYRTTISEIRKLLQETGFCKVTIQPSSKLTDLIYAKISNKHMVKLVWFVERMLTYVLGPSFSRSLYIVCQKIT